MNDIEFKQRLIAELHELNKNISTFNEYTERSLQMVAKYMAPDIKDESEAEEEE